MVRRAASSPRRSPSRSVSPTPTPNRGPNPTPDPDPNPNPNPSARPNPAPNPTQEHWLTLRVINEPGEGHAAMCAMHPALLFDKVSTESLP
jgi:hypothetical protein